MSLVSAFVSAVLPIIAIMTLGFVLASLIDLDAEPLNTVTLYAFLPALVFHSLATTTLGGASVLRVFAAVVGFLVVMLVIGEVIGRLAGTPEPFLSAAVLAGAFPNAGFYGIPLAEFAFGPIGRTTAVLYITALAVLMYTVGVYVASRAGGHGGISAVREIYRLPLVYAVIVGFVARWLGVVPPETGTVMTTTGLVGSAAIPLMLVVLGIQLADVEVTALTRAVFPTVLKLGVAPAVATGFVVLLAFEDPTIARVFILLSTTPVALTPLVLLMAYGDQPEDASASEYITTVIAVTTILSIPIITVLITLLNAGFPV